MKFLSFGIIRFNRLQTLDHLFAGLTYKIALIYSFSNGLTHR